MSGGGAGAYRGVPALRQLHAAGVPIERIREVGPVSATLAKLIRPSFIAPEGKLLGKIFVPELVSNICFGGRAKHELYITATTSLYRITLNRAGVQFP